MMETEQLDQYQIEPYLLDAHLESLLEPFISALRPTLSPPSTCSPLTLDSTRTQEIARVIYLFTKVRGQKAIVPLFPHQVHDLVSLLSILSKPSSILDTCSWELRYVLLLWLSVAIRVPFDLSKLPQHDTQDVEAIVGKWLGSSGKEREGAIEVLASYYSRKDSEIGRMIRLASDTLEDPQASSIRASSILTALCALLKNAPPTRLLPYWSDLYRLLAVCDERNDQGAARNRVKLAGRLIVLKLKDREGEVGEEVEVVVGELMERLGHQETVVRWSSAKHLARITAFLPHEIAEEIIEALISLFENSLSTKDAPELEEGRMQGCCFVFGELARRGLLARAAGAEGEGIVARVLEGAMQALLFDHRRGVQSIGSSVRDAASYVVWSLARTAPAAAIGEDLAERLARRLVCVACFDREIHVRRAASAAFQEGVGRWGIFPHGIAVLRKIDFFTISVRRSAFVEAASNVAQHIEYRSALLDHLVRFSLEHYDTEIHVVAAQALETIVQFDPQALAPGVVRLQLDKLSTKLSTKLHGVLLGLGALANAINESTSPELIRCRNEIFTSLTMLPPKLRALSTPHVLCAFLSTLTSSANPSSLLLTSDSWRPLVSLAGLSSSDEVHEASAKFYGKASAMMDCREDLRELMKDLGVRQATRQRWAAKVLGSFEFGKWEGDEKRVDEVVRRLGQFVRGDEIILKASSIEAKRNGVEAISRIVCSSTTTIDNELARHSIEATLLSFMDYSVDQRGDVGSWVRIAAIHAVPRYIDASLPALDQGRFDEMVANVLKQAVERLDNVREIAGEALMRIVRGTSANKLKMKQKFEEICSVRQEWRDLSWASERVLPLLAVQEYRMTLLEGAVLAFTRHASASPLVDFAALLPPDTEEGSNEYSLRSLLGDLVALGRQHPSANRVLVPVVDVLGSIVEMELVVDEEDDKVTSILQDALALATRSLSKIKTPARLTATTKFIVALVSLLSIRHLAVENVVTLLTHPIAPWIRQLAAEELSNQVGGTGEEDGGELERLVLETGWSEGDAKTTEADRVGQLLRSME